MKRKYLTQIWKDPVLSKVISVCIIAISTSIYGVVSSLITKKSFNEELLSIWAYKVELWFILLLLVIVYCVLLLAHNTFRYDDETLMLDRKLFNDIRNRPMMTEFMLVIKSNGLSNRPVSIDIIGVMIDLLEDSKKHEFEFLNPKLDKLKRQLILATKELETASSKYMFGTNRTGWVALPSEWELNDLQKIDKAKAIITPLENKLSDTYQDFISQGRRILKI